MEGQDTEWDEGPEEWAMPGHGSPEPSGSTTSRKAGVLERSGPGQSGGGLEGLGWGSRTGRTRDGCPGRPPMALGVVDRDGARYSQFA